MLTSAVPLDAKDMSLRWKSLANLQGICGVLKRLLHLAAAKLSQIACKGELLESLAMCKASMQNCLAHFGGAHLSERYIEHSAILK